MSQVIYKERKNTDCAKWDNLGGMFGKDDLLPLWVADMDFEVPKCVQERLSKYIALGTFGYYNPAEGYFQSFIDWEEKYHGYSVDKTWIRFAPGVVPAINWLIQMLTNEGDSVLIMPPVYYPFKYAIVNNKRYLVNSPLMLTDGGYEPDYEDFEKKIIDNDVKLFIFCSPHNPVGRVWKKDEILRLMEICKKHGVYVISDEIHQDLVYGDNEQIPTATVGNFSDMLITLTAATKTFNLAACQNSFVIIESDELRKKYDTFTENIHLTGGNAFGYIAVQAAYEGGREWLLEVLGIIEGNYKYLKNTIEEKLPGARVADLQGTYLLWIDLGEYVSDKNIKHFMTEECGLAVDYGFWFGGKDYDSFIRINLATRRENIVRAAEAIISGCQT